MSVAAVNSTTSTTASTGTVNDNSATAISDRFLKLLVTQLKNQDPMNPMDNAALTSQLAQLSTVEGINKMNDSMTALAAQFQATQALQGASLIGHQVLGQGSTLSLGSSGAAGAVDLASSADQVQINIQNSAGATVRTLNLGQHDAGLDRFTWDGKDTQGNSLAQGNYTYTVTATAAGNAVTATTYALDKVQSVTMNSTGLNVEMSNLGSLGLDKIKQIF
jgi:flagellar basal-body rod modification protein FlgD